MKLRRALHVDWVSHRDDRSDASDTWGLDAYPLFVDWAAAWPHIPSFAQISFDWAPCHGRQLDAFESLPTPGIDPGSDVTLMPSFYDPMDPIDPVPAEGGVQQPLAVTAPVGIITQAGLDSVEYIAALLTGTVWLTNSLTYSFPDTLSDWVGDDPNGTYNIRPDGKGGSLPDTNEPRLPGFGQVSAAEMDLVRKILADGGQTAATVTAFTTNLSFVDAGYDDAVMRIGQSDGYFEGLDNLGYVTTAAHTWLPFSGSTADGDIWFGTATGDLRSPKPGDYAYFAHLHEIGHALGLKHPHAGALLPDGTANAAILDPNYDGIEYTVMSYSGEPGSGVLNVDPSSFPTTYMPFDIAALQTLYGWDFSTNSGNTTYTWNPLTGEMSINGVGQGAPVANRILMTVYDGGGNDTYDMSNYGGGVLINLVSGGYSITSEGQRAILDTATGYKAHGTVYNTIVVQGDLWLLIENAIGGAGNDTLGGNETDNRFEGRAGSDYLSGQAGNDSLDGGDGNDTLYGGDGNDTLLGGGPTGYDLIYGEWGNDLIRGGASGTYYGGPGNDSIYGGSGAEQLIGDDGADSIEGGDGNDSIWGGDGQNSQPDGNDTLLGGAGDDQIVGHLGDDRLDGGEGNDFLFGWDGDDTIIGGNGNDTIRGDAGSDTLVGGGGADVFFYYRIDPNVSYADLIQDFTKGVDKIDLSATDPDPGRNGDQSFTFIGASDFSGRGKAEVRYVSGSQTVIEIDTGDGVADMAILLAGNVALTKTDFLL